jgi:uncharacterized membrane protein HdeD (DUF308 family)
MSVSGSLFLRGLCALEVGAISVAWPNVTILALVVLFAVFAFTMAATDLMLAFFSGRAGATLSFIVAAVLSAAAGVVALLWPSITALALTLWIAAWAIVSGVSEAVFAFRANMTAGERVLWIVTGLVTIAFGVVLVVKPDVGAVSLAMVFGLYSIYYGLLAVVLGFRVRSIGRPRAKSSNPRPDLASFAPLARRTTGHRGSGPQVDFDT